MRHCRLGTQDRYRPALQRVLSQAPENPPGHVWARRVEHKLTFVILRAATEAERDAFVASIKQDKERVANDALALGVGFIDLAAEQAHTKAAGISVIPV